jgi:dihydrolipoamide dehydrogenase
LERRDLIVIGAGPGGYVAAIRAAQLGLNTTLIEREARLGGTCLNVGCIPSKALLESSQHYARARDGGLGAHGVALSGVELDLEAMQQRKRQVVEQLTGGVAGLMKKNKVEVLHGRAELVGADAVEVHGDDGAQQLQGDNILLATGSAPVELPGLAFDGRRIVSSTEALAFERVPEHLVVVGAGAVGLELGQVWLRLGARVTVVEMLDQIVPFADKLMARMLSRALKAQGMELRTGSKVTAAEPQGEGLAVELALPGDETEKLECDELLVAVGRRPAFAGLGLEAAGVELDEQGRVAVDEQLRTSVPGIWAIGDLVRGPMLAHKAEEEGVAAVERMAGLPGHVNYDAIPGVVYTHPELALVGLTERECKQRGIEVRSGRFYYRANGRALAAGETDGLVQILADAGSDRLLGVQLLGPQASELVAEAVLAMEYQASAEDLARTIHAHPTLAEATKEAALAVDGRAIHA